MRFMMLVKANKDSEAGALPSKEMLAEMGQFNEEMAKAGVMLAGEGLHASSKGSRVKFTGGRATVTDGPFAATTDPRGGAREGAAGREDRRGRTPAQTIGHDRAVCDE